MSETPAPSAEIDALLHDAEAAYDREDQDWFNRQTTEALTALWASACDISLGVAWDDEVYEALAARGFFEDSPTPATKADTNA